VYCQIVDVIHPGKVALAKVNWKAKNDYEFIGNLKVLQSAFEKIGIKKHVEVEKLAKAKYQDNLEFIQWLKRYYSLNCGERGSGYRAEDRRSGANVDLSFAEKALSKTLSVADIETVSEARKGGLNGTATKTNLPNQQ
jgi:RP/EB family microtubule-associated protein